MKTLGNFLRFARLLIFANIGIVASIATAAPLRIMPLGDSITVGQYGVPTEGGYRTRLYELLSAQGIDVDFIGTQSDSINNTVLADRDHEGHGGYTIEDVRSGIASWLSQIANPDVVLLHIGTNDFWMGRTLEETRTSLSNLLGDIATLRPNARILVAKLIVRADAYGAIQEQFGREYLPGIIQEQVALGRRVSMVDLYPALDPNLHLLPDLVHPNLAGYVKMAEGWFPAIQQLINPGPSLVVNGSFEQGAAVSASANPAIPFDHFNLDNWTVAGNPAGFGQVAGVGATDGVRMAIFNGATNTYGGTVSQTFTTVAGATYQLQFDTGVIGGAGDNQLLGVAVTGNGGASLLAENVPVATTTGATTWVATSRSFTANGTATTLTFTDKSGTLAAGAATESDMLLDRVRVTNNGPANTAPIADNESYATTEGVALVIAAPGVLVGDTDGESDPLTAALVAGPSHGALALNADGSFTYTPASGYVGTDSFTYKANDGALDSNVATVFITVNSAGPSLLVNGSFEQGAAVSASANPAIPFDHFNLDNWTVAGNPAGFGQVTGVGATDGVRMAIFNGATNTYGGTVSQTFATVAGATYQLQFDIGVIGGAGDNQLLGVAVTGNGGASLLAEDVPVATPTGATVWLATSRSFTANGTATTLTFTDKSGTLAAGAATDSDMLLDRVRVVAISAPNTPPVADNESYATTGGVALVVEAPGVLVGDTDGESAPLTAVLVAGPSHGALALNADGSFTYTPASGYVGTDSFTYKANDGALNSNVATVSIMITTAGTLVNGSFEAGETGWTMSGNYLVYGNSAPYFAFNGNTMLVLNGGQTTPNAVISQTFGTIPGKTYLLEFNVGTLALNTSTASLAVGIAGRTTLLSESELLTGNGASTSNWTSRSHEFTADGNSATLTFRDLTANGNGIDLLLDNVRLTEKSPTNTAPVAGGDSYATNQNTPLVIVAPGLLANDSDLQNNTLTAVLNAGPAHGSLTLNANGGFTYTPATGYSGPDAFTYRANDGSMNSNIATVSITVNVVNTAPIASNDAYSAQRNTALTITAPGLLSNDSDAQNNKLTAVVNVAPAHGTLALNANGGFTYTPATGYSGGDSFTYHANDGSLNSNVATVSISVIPSTIGDLIVNGSFESNYNGWTASGNQSIEAALPYRPTNGSKLVAFSSHNLTPNGSLSQSFATVPGQTYTLSFDVGVLCYVKKHQKLGVKVTGSTVLLNRNISIKGTGGGANVWDANSYTFVADSGAATLSFSDRSVLTEGLDLLLDRVRVVGPTTSPNTEPVAVEDSYEVNQNTLLSVATAGLLGNDYDEQSNALSAVLDTPPAHGSLSLNSNGCFTYQPYGGYTGPDSFTYHANDGSLNSNTINVRISVSKIQPSLLLNPSFEANFTGWTTTGNQSIEYYKPTDGVKVADFNSQNRNPNATLAQSFATIPGKSYILTFDAGTLAYTTDSQSAEVKVTGNGSLLLDTINLPGDGTGIPRWARKGYSFIANSSTTTLAFRDLSTKTIGIDLLLDNIRVSTASVQAATVYQQATPVLTTPSFARIAGESSISTTAVQTGTYTLERSTDLRTWQFVDQAYCETGKPVQFHDTPTLNGSAAPQMFYRIAFRDD